MSSSSLGKQFGDCYRTAFGGLMDFDKEGRENVAVVHGNVFMPMEGRSLGHAWVEYDKPTDGGTQRMAVDNGTIDYEGPAEEYHEALGIKDARSYTTKEYMDRMARSMREKTPPYGPWDDE